VVGFHRSPLKGVGGGRHPSGRALGARPGTKCPKTGQVTVTLKVTVTSLYVRIMQAAVDQPGRQERPQHARRRRPHPARQEAADRRGDNAGQAAQRGGEPQRPAHLLRPSRDELLKSGKNSPSHSRFSNGPVHAKTGRQRAFGADVDALHAHHTLGREHPPAALDVPGDVNVHRARSLAGPAGDALVGVAGNFQQRKTGRDFLQW